MLDLNSYIIPLEQLRQLLQGESVNLYNKITELEETISILEISTNENDKQIVILNDLTIDYEVTLEGNGFNRYPIIIEGCKFKKFFLKEGNYIELRFFETETEAFIIKNVICKTLIIESIYSHNMIVADCQFNNFEIRSGIFYDRIQFINSVFKYNISILDGEFRGSVFFKDITAEKNFWIKGGEFNRSVRLYDNKIFYFEIAGGVFSEDVTFAGGEYKDEFYITDGIFLGRLRIAKGIYNYIKIIDGKFNIFGLSGGEFKKDILVMGGEFRLFRITNGKFESLIFKRDTVIEKYPSISHLFVKINSSISLNIDNIHINQLTLKFLFKSDSILIIQNLLLQIINLDNLVNAGRIIFNNIGVRSYNLYTLKLQNFLNANNIEFNNNENLSSLKEKTVNFLNLINSKRTLNSAQLEIQEITNALNLQYNQKSFLNITDCNLGNIEFRNVHFTDFEKIIISNSNLSTIKQYEIYLPTEEETKGKFWVLPKAKEKNVWQNRSDVYRDLYLASSTQQDTLKKIDYFASYQNAILKSPSKDYSAKLSIWLNKVTNNYGRNWIQSIVVTFLILGLVPFSLYMYTLNYKFSLTSSDIDKTLGYYFEFLIPTHKIDFIVENSKLSGASKLWDLTGRILIGIGLYQTIQSFRKMGKK